VLTIPGGPRERLSGAKLKPTQPPWSLGNGGRDRKSRDLADFLRWRLEAAV
jgi:hypothetical protein